MDLLDASRWHTGRRHSIEGPAGKHLPFEQIVLDPVHVLPAQQGWRTSPQFTLWFELQTCPLEQLPPQLMVPVPQPLPIVPQVLATWAHWPAQVKAFDAGTQPG